MAAKSTTERPPDVVDRIQAAWSDLHPDLDVSSIGIVTRIWRIGRHLETERNELIARFNTDRIVVDVLAELRRSGPPYVLSAGDLRELSSLSSGGVSQRLSRLEDLGLIVRSVDKGDRRVVNVHLTDKGIELIDSIVEEITKQEAKTLSAIPAKDRHRLEELLRSLLGTFE